MINVTKCSFYLDKNINDWVRHDIFIRRLKIMINYHKIKLVVGSLGVHFSDMIIPAINR